MTEMLLRFFEFDRWANRETLRSLETMKDRPQRAVALLAHIAATQRVWLRVSWRAPTGANECSPARSAGWECR